jgi:hypothetical protein
MNFESLTWNDIINIPLYDDHKKRKIIIVQLDDYMNKRYNAIIVKYDYHKNIHVRYLDNPFKENKYWWTGNKNNLPGLNPLSYHAKFLGDNYDEMEGLRRVDFQEDGYDDIINFDKESFRFFKSINDYPFMNGIYGNIHVHDYYISKFNKELSNNLIPDCIKSKTNFISDKILKIIVPNDNDTLFYNILEALPINFLPIVKDYINHKNNFKKIKKIIIDFKKILANMMTFSSLEIIIKN